MMNRRWECSTNTAITYSPQNADVIDDVHLISANGLLTFCMEYGIVSRSLLVNGKVLQGYLDASGTGLRHRNHSIDPTPDITACRLTSESGTVGILWGKRNGEVAVTTVNHVMDSGRASSMLLKCRVEDRHEGAVQTLIGDPPTQTFFSAGSDGRVKLWNWQTLRCLWVSDKQMQSLIIDPFLVISGGVSQGGIVGALSSGDICVWIIPLTLDSGELSTPIRLSQLRVSCPIPVEHPTHHIDTYGPKPEIRSLWLFRNLDSSISVFADYSDHSYFYHIHIQPALGKVETTRCGDSSHGFTSIVELVHPPISGKDGLIMAGDHLGFVRIYSIGSGASGCMTVIPAFTFEAHVDGAVTAIACDSFVLVTGSSQGTVTVWDALSLEPLRSFASPRLAAGRRWRSIARVLVRGELVVVVSEGQVMTWTAATPRQRQRTNRKNKHKRVKNITKKEHRKPSALCRCGIALIVRLVRHELQQDICESVREYEVDPVRHGLPPNRTRWLSFDTLGLSELEAVQYALILSREESSLHQSQSVPDELLGDGHKNLPGSPVFPQLPLSTTSQPTSSDISMLHCMEEPTSPPRNWHASEEQLLSTGIGSGVNMSFATSSGCNADVTMSNTLASSFEDFPPLDFSPSSTSSWKPSPVSWAPKSVWGHSKAALLPSTDSSRSVANEWDDDLRFAIALSLAEAHSLEEADKY